MQWLNIYKLYKNAENSSLGSSPHWICTYSCMRNPMHTLIPTWTSVHLRSTNLTILIHAFWNFEFINSEICSKGTIRIQLDVEFIYKYSFKPFVIFCFHKTNLNGVIKQQLPNQGYFTTCEYIRFLIRLTWSIFIVI